MLPSVYNDLPRREKAMIQAIIDMKVENDKKRARELENG